uniref:Matrix metallopeptidase 28 n=1 Tax=Catharus ustulatus TaxID=91951 RepID=A0A8C3UAY0_CATUS
MVLSDSFNSHLCSPVWKGGWELRGSHKACPLYPVPFCPGGIRALSPLKAFKEALGTELCPQGRHLTYRVVNWPSYLPQHEVRLAVRAAFELWSNVSSLLFWEVQQGPADIRLTFFHGDHNDGLNNAFDGPGAGRALAHAFFPRRGEAHFDSAERWSLHSGKGRNLFIVVAHEVGHTLGLQHSPVKSALMSPYYKKLSKDFVLSWDDILAVQNLYGEPGFPEHPSVPPGLFSGMDHYWVVSASGNASDPQPLQPRWPGLPAGIDACLVLSRTLWAVFNPPIPAGGRCWRYTGFRLDAGFPRKCSALGLPRHPDTALYFQQLRRLVLFKGPKYFVLGEEPLGVEPYYPRSLRDWAGLPPGTAGALTHRDASVYFFRDEHYWRFDQDKLRVVATGKWATQLAWMGCWDANTGTGVPQPGGLEALGHGIFKKTTKKKKKVSAMETANTPISVHFQDIFTRFSNQD